MKSLIMKQRALDEVSATEVGGTGVLENFLEALVEKLKMLIEKRIT
jgi:hypothetical protein